MALTTLLVIAALACLTSAQTPPPSSGDWVIDDSTTITGMTVDLNGSLIVNDDGQLALANVDLSFQSVATGSVGIIVHTGGSLMVNGGSVVSSNSEHYSFVVENGTLFRMENVTVSDMWHNDADAPNDIRGGLQIFADNAWLGNCTLTGNDRVAMTIVDADPRIEDCTFERSTYHTYYKYQYYAYRDAYGIIILDGAPRISRCTFDELGDSSTAFDDYTRPYYFTYLSLNGFGVYTVGGSPRLVDCTFTEIGRIQEDSYVDVYIEEIDEWVQFRLTETAVRGCIFSQGPELLEVTRCIIKDYYLGNAGYTTNAYGIYLFGGNLTVRASEFNNTNGSCIYKYQGNISLEDNLLKGYCYYGVRFIRAGSFTALNNTINGTNGSRPITNQVGFMVEDNQGDPVVIEGFDISSCYSGLWFRNSRNITVSEGALTDCYNGIASNNVRDIEVRDIVFSACYYGLYLYDANILRTYDLTISDCTYGLYHRSAQDWDCHGLDISDCDLGLFISGIGFIVGRDIAVTDCTQGMTFYTCAKVDIRHLNVSGSGTGILISGGSEIALRAFKIVGYDDPMNITYTSVSFHDGIIESGRSKMYVVRARVDCYNVTIGLAEVELGPGYTTSVVSLYFYLGAQVSWQSGHPAPFAQVMITNETEETLLNSMANVNGTLSPKLVMQGQVVGDGQGTTRYTNNKLLDAVIIAGGLTSDVNKVTFTGNTIVDLVIADRSRPQLSIATPTPHHIQRERVLLVSGLASDMGSGIERVQVSVDGENWHIADGLELWTITLTLDEGVYDILVEAYDLIGKATGVVEDITIDTSPPLLTVEAPLSGHSQDTSILLVHGSAQDLASGLAWVKATINGTSWTLAQGRGTWNLTLEVPDGVHDLQVMAADQLGLTTLVMVRDVLVDTTDPVAYVGPDLETDQGHPVVLDGTLSHDNIGISNWTWRFEYDGENRTLDGELVVFTFDIPREYTITLEVTDGLGHSAFAHLRVNVRDTMPPLADAGLDIETEMGMRVTFDFTGSTDNRGIGTYEWSISPEQGARLIDGTTYIFDEAGTYQLTLRVEDLEGNSDTDTARITVRDADPPVAVAGPDRTIIQGATTVLNGLDSTDNVGITGLRWSFEYGGETQQITEWTAVWLFDVAGEYNVELWVDDAAGNSDKDTLVVTVLPSHRSWLLGPFVNDEGDPMRRVEVMVVLNGTVYTGLTDDAGWADLLVGRTDLVTPVHVQAEKEGWSSLDFNLGLDGNGVPIGTPPPMSREQVEGTSTPWWLLATVVLAVVAVVLAMIWIPKLRRREGSA